MGSSGKTKRPGVVSRGLFKTTETGWPAADCSLQEALQALGESFELLVQLLLQFLDGLQPLVETDVDGSGGGDSSSGGTAAARGPPAALARLAPATSAL